MQFQIQQKVLTSGGLSSIISEVVAIAKPQAYLLSTTVRPSGLRTRRAFLLVFLGVARSLDYAGTFKACGAEFGSDLSSSKSRRRVRRSFSSRPLILTCCSSFSSL